MADSRSSQARLPDDRTSIRLPVPADSSTEPDRLDDDLTVISMRGPLADRGDGPLLKPLEVGKMLEGERLGQFVLERYVGGGGMGVVFRALDTTLNREVAVKVLAHSQSHDEETLRRFQNEAQSAARLDHENIARVYYVGEDRGVHYIVFEFIEGVNIRDLVQRDGPLSLVDAISFTVQVAEALSHASQRDVIHRDIKPSNVLITPEGKAKLVDMGLARLHQVGHSDNDLTASGVTLGTFDYISPEQARDPRSADVRSDLYSLGCSFYYMLTGRPPFPDGTVLQKLLQHQAEDPLDPRQLRPELPKEIGAILAKLLAKNPDRRYQTPAELIADLGALSHEGSSPRATLDFAYARPHRAPVESPWRRHLPWLVPIAALILFVLAHEYWYNDDWRVWQQFKPRSSSRTSESTRQSARPRPKSLAGSESSRRSEASPPSGADAALPTDGQPPESLAIVEPADARSARPAWGGKLDWHQLQYLNGLFNDWLHKFGGEDRPGNLQRPAEDLSDGSAPSTPSGLAAVGAAVPVGTAKTPLVVAPNRQGERIYANVQAAVSAAVSGDVVELDFDGRLEERPFELANIDLTVRAAQGRRPILVFRPGEAAAVGYPRSMVVVAGGSLSISGVEVELEMPRKISAETWALIEIRRAERLQLQRTTLTIRNAGANRAAFHPSVAFFDLRTPLGSDTMGMGATLATAPPQIELVDCVVRGEATCLRTSEFEPVWLRWNNGLLATSETLLQAEAAAGRARASGGVEIELRRVTAIVRGGLARLTNNEDLPYLLDTKIECIASAIVTDSASPLIQQRGIDTISQFRGHFIWSAKNVDFEGPELFWRIVSTPTGETSELNFAEWEAFWEPKREGNSRRGLLPWLIEAAAKRRLSELSPADLVAHPAGDAEIAAVSDLGGEPRLLPIPSIPSPTETPASSGSKPVSTR
jgi:eukaryotic-like serine/threonine-protein kinase